MRFGRSSGFSAGFRARAARCCGAFGGGFFFVAHGDVDAIYRSNVVGTRNLLQAIKLAKHRPRAVLLASSANIYGNTDIDCIAESTPPAPANDYAVSKIAMEYVAKLYADDLPLIIVRPFNYTGVGQAPQFLLPKIVGHFARAVHQ
ncbi:NAD-dependent epimerase/dehydratase family protein [Deefgea sp. CFH1-16]|uniref:NAD-dependent epimerase/dehydratase family protein n=1 Tax=Deefgea sp. CFH1-16 TaxID=2675457 RepID=UPI001FFD0952|nr:NAD-dependent epimerase/dehydratase family protein [Deefgea sp. CFH1-16]